MPAASPPPCLQRGDQTQEARPKLKKCCFPGGLLSEYFSRGCYSKFGLSFSFVFHLFYEGVFQNLAFRSRVEPKGPRKGTEKQSFSTLGDHLGDPGPTGRPQKRPDRKRLPKSGSRVHPGAPEKLPLTHVLQIEKEIAIPVSFFQEPVLK